MLFAVFALLAIPIIIAITQRYLWHRVLVVEPDVRLMLCRNCMRWLRPTVNGWLHIQMGGTSCHTPTARPVPAARQHPGLAQQDDWPPPPPE